MARRPCPHGCADPQSDSLIHLSQATMQESPTASRRASRRASCNSIIACNPRVSTVRWQRAAPALLLKHTNLVAAAILHFIQHQRQLAFKSAKARTSSPTALSPKRENNWAATLSLKQKIWTKLWRWRQDLASHGQQVHL